MALLHFNVYWKSDRNNKKTLRQGTQLGLKSMQWELEC